MIKIDYITEESIRQHNPNWPKIPNRPYKILTIGDSGSEKTKVLFSLIKQQDDDSYSIINKK